MDTVQNRISQEMEPQSLLPLNQLYFYLTKGCNLACRHCWLAPRFDRTGSRYPTLRAELFETAIREAKPLGLQGVKLTGGEPLLHPQFKKLLEIVRREGLSLNIETNGLLCTPEIAEEIAKSTNRFVSVSIDGADAATHEWVRGVPGCFETALQAVRNLVAAGISPQIVVCVMRCNADQVESIVRLAENLGAASVKFNILQPVGRGEAMHEGTSGLEIAELIRLGRHVDMELAPTTKVELLFEYPPAFRPLSRMASGNDSGMCGILGILGVIASGHYALCGIGEHLQEFTFGVVGTDPLKDLWRDNVTLNALRVGLPTKFSGICARCLMSDRCLGYCIAQNYYRKGSIWAPFWFCEDAERLGLFPNSRLEATAVR